MVAYTNGMREEGKLLGIIKIDAFKCEKCGHIWISRMYTKDDPPVTCAKCKNPYWNRPKVKK
jgi:predicted nucleic acid-binding Zn ribbon protein